MPRKPLSQVDIECFRDTFCEAAYALYVRDDYAAVTMRGIAKELGCSPMMAYRYFENKEEVFATLRAMRFLDLARALEDVPGSLPPAEYMTELGKAYAGFAHQAPHAYRLLYMLPVPAVESYPEVTAAQEQTQRILFAATRRLVAAGGVQDDPVLLAHTLWASIHGLVSLDLANQLTKGASFEELFPAMLDRIIKSG